MYTVFYEKYFKSKLGWWGGGGFRVNEEGGKYRMRTEIYRAVAKSCTILNFLPKLKIPGLGTFLRV